MQLLRPCLRRRGEKAKQKTREKRPRCGQARRGVARVRSRVLSAFCSSASTEEACNSRQHAGGESSGREAARWVLAGAGFVVEVFVCACRKRRVGAVSRGGRGRGEEEKESRKGKGGRRTAANWVLGARRGSGRGVVDVVVVVREGSRKGKLCTRAPKRMGWRRRKTFLKSIHRRAGDQRPTHHGHRSSRGNGDDVSMPFSPHTST